MDNNAGEYHVKIPLYMQILMDIHDNGGSIWQTELYQDNTSSYIIKILQRLIELGIIYHIPQGRKNIVKFTDKGNRMMPYISAVYKFQKEI